jgi:hypothetical protein
MPAAPRRRARPATGEFSKLAHADRFVSEATEGVR